MKSLTQLLAILALTTSLSASEFSNLQKVEPSDNLDDIVTKAAHVVPTHQQLLHHQDEFTAFIHFGPNSFSGVEWGSGMEKPETFAPTNIDTDQWCKHIKAAGMSMVVMTFKHHDGYVLWQSRYENHQSIKNSPYKNGKADIAKQLSESCAKYGLKFGIYLSPADLYQIESKNGLYGNLSKIQKTTIPTDPKSFKTNPTKVRADKPADAPTFTFQCDDYNRYMLNQLYEMLTDYGPVHEVWFDGAHPKRKGGQKYNYADWYALIRKLAPKAVIAIKGPDVRWCGNEAGRTRDTEWNVLPLAQHPNKSEWPDSRGADLGSRGKLKNAKYLFYRHAETNTSIRSGWFYQDDTHQDVRTPDDVFDIYERSVGGNSVFLLNIPPNRDGKFSKRDADCLDEVGRRILATYGTNLAKDAELSAPNLTDGNISTYWQPKNSTGEITITLPEPRKVNRLMLQEAITKRGQRIETHALDAWINGKWQQISTGTTVGYKKILRFADTTTDKFRLRITKARLIPSVSEISLHYYDSPPLPVTASRTPDGRVSLKFKSQAFHGKGKGFKIDTKQFTIRYTTDGSTPNSSSTAYGKPISLPDGGTMKAAAFAGDKAGPVSEFLFGIASNQLHATASTAQNKNYDATKAIDGNPATFWHSKWSKPAPTHPHTLTIDLANPRKVTGITYLPRQDKAVPDGMIEQGKIEISTDGKNWTDAGTFLFGNLLNDPSQRVFRFPKAHQGRYLRLSSLKGTLGTNYAGAAELGVLSH